MRLTIFGSRRAYARARRWRAFVDDLEVTDRCQALDTRAGWALVLKWRAGAPYVDERTNTAAREILRGRVTVQRRAKAKT